MKRKLYILCCILGIVLCFSGCMSRQVAYAQTLKPILSDASLLLSASSLPQDWQYTDGWTNQGTAGANLNPKFDAGANNADARKRDPFYSDTISNVPGIISPRDDTAMNGDEQYDNSYGFYIPDNKLLDIPDTGGWTITFDVTPLRTDVSSKLVWKYTQSDMPRSGGGWVMEKVFNNPYVLGPEVSAAYDGSNFAASLGSDVIAGRQRITVRVDRDAHTWRQFRNGIQLDNAALGGDDLTNFGSAKSLSDLLFGPGWSFHNIVLYNRALSDAEIMNLNAVLASNQIYNPSIVPATFQPMMVSAKKAKTSTDEAIIPNSDVTVGTAVKVPVQSGPSMHASTVTGATNTNSKVHKMQIIILASLAVFSVAVLAAVFLQLRTRVSI